MAGAQYDDGVFLDMGSGYVFAWDGLQWLYESKLMIAQGQGFDRLGMSTAAASDFMLIGSRTADDGDVSSGGVYGFSRQSDASWQQTAAFFPPIPRDGDLFGSIALSESSLVVGAYGNDDFILSGGAAFVFERDDSGAWQLVAELV